MRARLSHCSDCVSNEEARNSAHCNDRSVIMPLNPAAITTKVSDVMVSASEGVKAPAPAVDLHRACQDEVRNSRACARPLGSHLGVRGEVVATRARRRGRFRLGPSRGGVCVQGAEGVIALFAAYANQRT